MVERIIPPAQYKVEVDLALTTVEALTTEQHARYKEVMSKIKQAEQTGAMMTRASIAQDVRIILQGLSTTDMSSGSVNRDPGPARAYHPRRNRREK